MEEAAKPKVFFSGLKDILDNQASSHLLSEHPSTRSRLLRWRETIVPSLDFPFFSPPGPSGSSPFSFTEGLDRVIEKKTEVLLHDSYALVDEIWSQARNSYQKRRTLNDLSLAGINEALNSIAKCLDPFRDIINPKIDNITVRTKDLVKEINVLQLKAKAMAASRGKIRRSGDGDGGVDDDDDIRFSDLFRKLLNRMSGRQVTSLLSCYGSTLRGMEKLVAWFWRICDVLMDAEEKRANDEKVANWFDRVRDLYYEAEEVVEQIEAQATRWRVSSPTQISDVLETLKRIADSLDPFPSGINQKLDGIISRTEDLVKEAQVLKLKADKGNNPIRPQPQPRGSRVDGRHLRSANIPILW